MLIGATNLDKGRYETFTEQADSIVGAVMASSAIPGLFPIIRINNDGYVDGGVCTVFACTEMDSPR